MQQKNYFVLHVTIITANDDGDQRREKLELSLRASDFDEAVKKMPERIYDCLVEKHGYEWDLAALDHIIDDVSLLEVVREDEFTGKEDIFVECLTGIKERIRLKHREEDRKLAERDRDQLEDRERAELQRLKTKYETPGDPDD